MDSNTIRMIFTSLQIGDVIKSLYSTIKKNGVKNKLVYISNFIIQIEGSLEYIFEVLNEKCNQVVIISEILILLCRLREFLFLLEKGITYFVAQKTYQELEIGKYEISHNNINLSNSGRKVKGIEGFEFSRTYLERLKCKVEEAEKKLKEGIGKGFLNKLRWGFTQLKGKPHLLIELLSISRRFFYMLLMLKCGSSSLKPLFFSIFVDSLMFFNFKQNIKTSKNIPTNELAMLNSEYKCRKLSMIIYFFRSPIYQVFTTKLIALLATMLFLGKGTKTFINNLIAIYQTQSNLL